MRQRKQNSGYKRFTSERVKIVYIRYRDNGEPTCAINFATLKVCPFYCTTPLGQRESCCLSMHPLGRRGENGMGSLIPHEDCPLFAKKELVACQGK